MKKLSYKKAFSKYSVSLSKHLSRFTYNQYKNIRLGLADIFPIKENEKYYFEDHNFGNDPSSDMPMGFSYSAKEDEEGYLKLEYIDFFDYLPKEELTIFQKALRKFVLRNKASLFHSLDTAEANERFDSMGRYVDWWTFTNLHGATLTSNEYLEQYSSQVTISLRNLSPSFLVVKYRFYISDKFNECINAICKKKYPPCTDVWKPFNIPWYKPRKFGRSMLTGDDAREKEFYALVTRFKWNAFVELKRYFTIHFEHDYMFPPTFETYSTNIRPSSSRENERFWKSAMLGYSSDYAQKYNACVCWDYECGQHEGKRLSAYCGGNYVSSDRLPEIVIHDLADTYAVYMTASTLNRIAERDIAKCNKKISKAIRKAKVSLVLKVRLSVEQQLYYSYRFISEFTGKTIDQSDADEFRDRFQKDSSISAENLKSIADSTAETKKQIDTLLQVLDVAAEYGSSKSNLGLQWAMTIVTIFSLIVAIIAILGFDSYDIKTLWSTIPAFIYSLFSK